MYRQFRFEGAVHETLECVPLTVRRKLDLAGLKISLVGWQTLPFAERLALCHLPVDAADELAVYRRVLRGFAERAAVPLHSLPEPPVEQWRGIPLPSALATRLSQIDWARLDEEERYALVKLAEPHRDTAKLLVLLAELGLGAPVSAPASDGRCEPRPV